MNNIYKWLRGKILKKLGKRESTQKEVLRNERLFGGGMFSFFKKKSNELTVEEWFSTISNVHNKYETEYKKNQKSELTKMYSTEYLNLRKIFNNEEFVRNLKEFLLNLKKEEDLEEKLKILSDHDLIGYEFKEEIRRAFNKKKFMRYLSLVKRDSDANVQSKPLSSPELRGIIQSKTFSSPELRGIIQSYGMQYIPKDLFNFLKSIEITELTELTESQKSTMFSFKTYFESNTEEINKFLESEPEEEKSKYKNLLLKFKFITE